MSVDQLDFRERVSRLSTASLSDALDSLGLEGGLQGMAPRAIVERFAGPAFTVKYERFSERPKEFQNAGNYIDEVPAGHVVVIDNQGALDCTSWGGILTAVAKIRGLAATVVNGSVRDVDEIRESGYPVFSQGVFMQSGKNRVQKVAHQVPVQIGSVLVQPGDFLVGDASGVVVIPKAVAAEVLARAEAIERTESRILEAVRGGQELVVARKEFGYQAPWKN